MRYLFSVLLIFSTLLSLNLAAQDRQKVTDKSGTKYNRIEEVYYVLKGESGLKDGPYQYSRNEKVLVTGYYDHGQKDSVWEVHSWAGLLVSRTFYAKGQRTGVWNFFGYNGEPEWTYDCGANTFSIQKVFGPFSDTSVSYYQSDSGGWVKGHVDRPLLALNGTGDWISFLTRTMRYPDEAVNKEQMGEVIVAITVDEKGAITDYGLAQTAYPSLDTEALRVVKLYPFEFIPAEKDGRKIKAQFRLPVRFKLERAN